MIGKGLKKNIGLKVLNLQGNKICEKGLNSICQNLKFNKERSSLRELSLSKC